MLAPRLRIVAPLTALIFALNAFWPGALSVAFAHNAQASENSLPVVEIASEESDASDDVEDFHAAGSVDQIGDNFIVIGGQTFSFNETTQFDAGIEVGAVVRLEYIVLPDGSFLAVEVETDAPDEAPTDDDLDPDLPDEESEEDFDDEEDFEFTGVIEALSGTSVTISGQTFSFDANSELDEGLQVGVVATVEFRALSDGSFLVLEIETDADDDLDLDDDEDEADDEDEDDEDNSGHGNSHDDDDDDDNSGHGNGHDDDDDDDDEDNSGRGNSHDEDED